MPNPSGDYPGVVKPLLERWLRLRENTPPFALDHGLREIEAILLEYNAAFEGKQPKT